MYQTGQSVEITQLLPPQAVSADTNSLVVNTSKYQHGCELVVYVGAATGTPNSTNKINVIAQESADTAAANFAEIAAASGNVPSRMCVNSAGVVNPSAILLDSAGEFGGKIYRFPLRPAANKPYARVSLDVSGTISAPIAVWAQGMPPSVPVSTVVDGTAAT